LAASPFSFASVEQARVISGEEEAAYAWAGVNFVTGSLLEASQGSGAANPTDAFGTLEVSEKEPRTCLAAIPACEKF